MKLKFDVDCTPEELRRAFGLPDLKPMQDVVMGKMEQQLLDALSGQSPEAILKAWMPYWLPVMGHSPEQAQKAMSAFFSGLFNAPTKREQ